jgi:signal transduction histidine kinase/CheY-like chemotaxis protein
VSRSSQPAIHERILILAPTGRDADLTAKALDQAGIASVVCASIEDLCLKLAEGAGAAMVTDEAMSAEAMDCLREALEREPAWSDIPLLIFTSTPAAEVTAHSFDPIGTRGNITLIERPIRVKTMISAAQTALRARRRQYEVRELLQELERRVDERDQFLAMLSHELRNPLAAIALALSDAEGAPTAQPEEGAASAHEILVRQTRHLTRLVDDLLDIGRITSGKIMLNRAPVDLGEIVEHCVRTMRPRIDRRSLRLDLRLDPQRAVLNGDAVRLEQVITNLLSNAIKYTHEGGFIEVVTERQNGEAVLCVRDNGKGIAPEMLPRIFDLFMQGEVSIDRSEGGMGIGLTLVRKLVELHGGSVRAFSKGTGTGSELMVRLPLAESLEMGPPPVRGAAAPSPRRAQSRSIVVVEDNADVRDLLRIKLRQLGHRVEVAEDGMRGLEKVVETRPDVALIDIGLPGIDGYEVARRIRKELGASILLVALTGYGQVEDRTHALAAGFDVHLTKPAELAELQAALG